MKLPAPKRYLPAPLSAVLAALSAILLVLAFPGFEFSFLAWFALVPLFFAVEREKQSAVKSFVTGWIFGTLFFFGSCWWLTFAPITYAGFPFLLAYFLLFLACLAVGFFSAIFAALFSILLKRFGNRAILTAPFLWTALEFLRFWATGNNWNAIGYSQAFAEPVKYASFGGIYLISFLVILTNALLLVAIEFVKAVMILKPSRKKSFLHILSILMRHYSPVFGVFFSTETKNAKKIAWRYKPSENIRLLYVSFIFLPLILSIVYVSFLRFIGDPNISGSQAFNREKTKVIAVQPNVPMSGLNYQKYQQLRRRHVELAESALREVRQTTTGDQPTIVIFPESPMNFMYSEDTEFQSFVKNFAAKNNVSVLFNAAEPDARGETYFNSAVMVDASGAKIAQYDKIYLVPFGENVPAPLKNIVPALVGSFSYGEEYDLLPFGEAKAGVMICFESHFGVLSREFVRNGADVLVEMTNDGYLGNTPILRQHLANAVFRAVETNRPVLRVTNVGITAYINERGEISDAADAYTEATRTWTVSKSDGNQTIYVKYGDWFAWLCSLVSLALLFLSFWNRKR